MATKKEGAQRLLDSLDSAVRIKQRLWLAIAQGVIISVTVAWFTRWQFGVAASLVFVLLIQLAFERMSKVDSGLGELEIGRKCNQSVRCRATHACQYDNEFTRVASDSFVIWSRIDSLAARVNQFWTRYVCTWVWRLLFILINTGRGHLCVLAASAERF